MKSAEVTEAAGRSSRSCGSGSAISGISFVTQGQLKDDIAWPGVLWRCLTFLLVQRVPGGRKVLKTGTNAEKHFENWYNMPCPALEAPSHAQAVILYIAVPFRFPFSLACADHMYTPVGGKAPSVLFGASLGSLWEPRAAPPAWWCGVRVCARRPVALARSAGCQARCVPCRAVLRGSRGVCAGASVRLPEARAAWLGGTPAFSVAWRFSGPPAMVAANSVL